MNGFTEIQARLNELIPMPSNLPVVYLLGDTGAGKTCFVRQMLGTTNQSFPSVRRLRTTVAPTDFIITREPELKAAFLFKSEHEVARCVTEILEAAVLAGIEAAEVDDSADIGEILANSPDERFRLSCFLDETARTELGRRLLAKLVTAVKSWIQSNFPDERDLSTAVGLALDDNEFRAELDAIRGEILRVIGNRLRQVCEVGRDGPLPASFRFTGKQHAAFIERLKLFLSVDADSISPLVEKARVRGPLRSTLIPDEMELVVIDGEGIGHDAREAKVLSARHFDYFYASDAIVLVEDSETPFTAGGKGALAAIVTSGYLPKLFVAFSRLDKVEAERAGRSFQIREVERSLRNVLNALRDDGVRIEKQDLKVRYFAHMNTPEPDEESRTELTSLLESVLAAHGQVKARFVTPKYDFELLAGFLAQANTALRQTWNGYIRGEGVPPAPWQTQKAFAIRMSWKQDEYRFLKPVAEFSELLLATLSPFVERPMGWAEEITQAHQTECIQRLKQELRRGLLEYIRRELLDEEHPDWQTAADLRGTGSTFDRRRIILEVIYGSAPELTGEHAGRFKDAIKSIIVRAIQACGQSA